MDKKKTIVIDFDGTIVTHAFPYIGPIKPMAAMAIRALHQEFNIIISSCRNNPKVRYQGKIDTLQAMEDWLIENNIPFDMIDDGKSGKPIADFYIDDKAIRFENQWGRLRDTLSFWDGTGPSKIQFSEEFDHFIMADDQMNLRGHRRSEIILDRTEGVSTTELVADQEQDFSLMGMHYEI